MRRSMLASIVLALVTVAVPCQAGFILDGASNYGILIEPGASSYQLNNSTVFGNVGLGSGVSPVQIASNGFISPAPGVPGSGRLDLVDASATISNPGNVSGGVFFNQSQVTTAINAANSLNSTLGAEAGVGLHQPLDPLAYLFVPIGAKHSKTRQSTGSVLRSPGTARHVRWRPLQQWGEALSAIIQTSEPELMCIR